MPDVWLEKWSTAIEEFPLERPPAEQLRALVRYAVLAPSSHNTQPWRFRLVGDALELLADRTRALPIVDPLDRELVISCGAALHQAEIAARHFGLHPEVELLPDDTDDDLLARVRLRGSCAETTTTEALFAAMPRRHTWRGPFDERVPPLALVQRLAAAALEEGVLLHVVSDPGRKALLAELVMEGDRRQMADAAFRHELAAWLRPNRTTARDGMPGYALGMSAVAAALSPLVVRTFDLGGGRAARDRELAVGSPLLAVLATEGNARRDWLQAGRALARVLLLACDAGVRASFLNQPVEVADLRPRLAALVRSPGHPQLVLRLGYGPEGAATPRRPLEEVLV